MGKLFVTTIAGALGCLTALGAIDLKESKFTQVVNDVQIISTADNSKHAASVDGVFKMPDVLRTGPGSRAELVAADNTITRVGANTIFSFDAATRSIHLEQGSLLFNTPKGKGGGSIHTAAATAAVLGTTIIVVTTPSGGFKVLTLEGTAEVKFLKGMKRTIHAGQLIFVLPGSLPGPILSFRLDEQVSGSRLVTGFNKPLASLPKVNAQINQQQKQIASGKATDTGLLAGNSASSTGVQVISSIALDNAVKDPFNGPPGGGGGSPSTNTTTTTPPAGPLPPGFVTPPGLTFISTSPKFGTPAQVGGFINPDGVIFIRPDPSVPIEYPASPGAATVGAANDVSIGSASLDPTHVFTAFPVDVIAPNSVQSDQTVEPAFTGFAARNLTINTPTVDLSPYSSLTKFGFLGSQSLTIASSLDTGPRTAFGGEIDFVSVSLTISPGVTLNSDSPLVKLAAVNSVSLNQVKLVNTGGIELDSFASLSLIDTPISGTTVTLSSGGPLSLANSEGPSQITGSSSVNLSSDAGITVGVNLSSDRSSGSVDLENFGGMLSVLDGIVIGGSRITLDSPGGINIGAATFAGGSSVNIQSENGVTLNGANINATAPSGSLQINDFSGRGLTVNNGTTLSGAFIGLDSFGTVSLDSSSVGTQSPAPTSQITLESSSTMSLNQTAVYGNTISLSSGGPLSLSGDPVMNLGNVTAGSSASLNSFEGMTVGVNVSSTGSTILQNDFGQLYVNNGAHVSGGSVELFAQNGTLLIDPGVTIQGSSSVQLVADFGMTVSGNVLADPSSGFVSLSSSEGNIVVNPGVQITGNSISLDAPNGTLSTDGNSVVTGNSGVTFHSTADMTIGGNISAINGTASLATDNGPLVVNSGVQVSADSIIMNSGGTLQTGSTTVLQGSSQVQLTSATGMNISGSITATSDGGNGPITLVNNTGLMNVNNGGNANARFTASVISFNSPDGILINTPGQVSAGTMTVSAVNQSSSTATIQNADLSGVGQLNVNGHTIVMSDVALPNSGNSHFFTDNGVLAANPNTRAQIILGDLNFFQNVTYQGQLANTPGTGFTVGRLP
jgi:hypothetical protein